MSFTGRIRLYLVAIALLPPILMMAVVYFYSAHQAEISHRRNAAGDLRKLIDYHEQFRTRLMTSLENITDHTWFEQSVRLAQRGRNSRISFDDLRGFGLDFYELTDPDGRVVASSHRPGLIGEMISNQSDRSVDRVSLFETVEYDIDGPRRPGRSVSRQGRFRHLWRLVCGPQFHSNRGPDCSWLFVRRIHRGEQPGCPARLPAVIPAWSSDRCINMVTFCRRFCPAA